MSWQLKAVLIGIYPWFPESPYYLIQKGRVEEARKSLNRIHGSSDQGLIEAELLRIQSNITFSNELHAAATSAKGPILLQCFQKPNLKRTLIACMAAVQQQCVGSTFVLGVWEYPRTIHGRTSNLTRSIGFFTYFLSLLGIDDFFTVTLALSIVMTVACVAAFPLIETVGRRKLLVPGTFILTGSLLVIGICGCFNNKAATWVFLVSVFFWGAVYQCTLGAVGFAFGSEVPSLPMRAATVSLMGFSQMAGYVLIRFQIMCSAAANVNQGCGLSHSLFLTLLTLMLAILERK